MRQMWFGILAITAGAGFYATGCGGTTESTGSTGTGGSASSSSASSASSTASGSGGAGGTGVASSTGSTGGAGGCATAADCPDLDTECKKPTCNQGVCGFTNVPEQTPVGMQTAGDCKKIVCDGQGNTVTADDDADVLDDGKQCTSDVCKAGVASTSNLATGTACAEGPGKFCDGMGKCVECNANPDCASGICTQSVCAPASCMDSLKNGTETDVDCGGPTCPKCVLDKVCSVGTDCETGACANNVCAAPSCNDGVKNGTETDIDCGGGCATKCALAKVCSTGADCASTICTGGVCSQINGCDPTTALDKTTQSSVTINFGGGFGFAYSPKCIKVTVGAKVVLDGGLGGFSNHPFVGGEVKGGMKVQAVSGPFIPIVTNAALASKTFTMSTAGAFPYYCDFHALAGMNGTVFVVP